LIQAGFEADGSRSDRHFEIAEWQQRTWANASFSESLQLRTPARSPSLDAAPVLHVRSGRARRARNRWPVSKPVLARLATQCGGAWPWGRASLPERRRDRPSSPACVIFLGFPSQRGFGPLRDQSALLLGERSMLNAGSEPPRARRLHSHPPKIGRQGTDVGLEPFCRGSSVSVLGLAARRYPSESASKELSTTAYFQFE
jgi:hypothetical protein